LANFGGVLILPLLHSNNYFFLLFSTINIPGSVWGGVSNSEKKGYSFGKRFSQKNEGGVGRGEGAGVKNGRRFRFTD
jgi:hypothetical protein